MANPIVASLSEGFTLLDGGMGRELLRRGMEQEDQALWSANALLSDPDLVQTVHEDYLRAGAGIITTNTYATPRERLASVGLEDRFEELNQRAGTLAEQARDTVSRDALIAGSLPPIRGSYRPDLVGEFEEIEPQYRELAEVLAPSVDLFICETMATGEEARAAATGAVATGKPVLVSWTLVDDVPRNGTSGLLRSNESLEEVIAAVSDLPIAGILVNCCPPETITVALPRLKQLTDLPVGGYANGFEPIPEGWVETSGSSPGTRNDLSPSEYAGHVRQWLSDGAQIVGGCCEIGPDHIAHLHGVVETT